MNKIHHYNDPRYRWSKPLIEQYIGWYQRLGIQFTNPSPGKADQQGRETQLPHNQAEGLRTACCGQDDFDIETCQLVEGFFHVSSQLMRAIEKRSIYINRNQSDRWIHIFTRVLSDGFAMLPSLYAHICDADSKSGQ